jgi:ATP-dependent Clp protease ATP-binding subunit ClpC
LILEVTDPAKQLIADKGYDPEYGARPLRRVITNMVEDRLSDGILSGAFKLGSTVRVGVNEDNTELSLLPIEGAPALLDESDSEIGLTATSTEAS